MIIGKLHTDTDGKEVLALCDSDLVGKKIEEGKKQLDLTSSFYKGKEMKDDQLDDLLKVVYLINAVGTEVVEFLKQKKLVAPSQIITIANIPHAQVVVMR